jgi:hypothetical protein
MNKIMVLINCLLVFLVTLLIGGCMVVPIDPRVNSDYSFSKGDGSTLIAMTFRCNALPGKVWLPIYTNKMRLANIFTMDNFIPDYDALTQDDGVSEKLINGNPVIRFACNNPVAPLSKAVLRIIRIKPGHYTISGIKQFLVDPNYSDIHFMIKNPYVLNALPNQVNYIGEMDVTARGGGIVTYDVYDKSKRDKELIHKQLPFVSKNKIVFVSITQGRG